MLPKLDMTTKRRKLTTNFTFVKTNYKKKKFTILVYGDVMLCSVNCFTDDSSQGFRKLSWPSFWINVGMSRTVVLGRFITVFQVELCKIIKTRFIVFKFGNVVKLFSIFEFSAFRFILLESYKNWRR